MVRASKKQIRSERYIMLITPALAQSGGLSGGGLGGLMPIVLVMVIFYFLLIRPQQKRAKQHKEMLAAVAKGDKIITNGGIEGKVTKVVDDSETIEVEIAKDVKVNVVRTMIADVRGKNAPAPDAKPFWARHLVKRRSVRGRLLARPGFDAPPVSGKATCACCSLKAGKKSLSCW